MTKVVELKTPAPNSAFEVWAKTQKGLNRADAYAGWCAGIDWYQQLSTNKSEDGK